MNGLNSRPIRRLRFPAWQGVYDATLRETEKSKLFTLVELSEAMILTRRDALKDTSRGRSERRAIEQALQALWVIKKERLGFEDGDYGNKKSARRQRTNGAGASNLSYSILPRLQ